MVLKDRTKVNNHSAGAVRIVTYLSRISGLDHADLRETRSILPPDGHMRPRLTVPPDPRRTRGVG